MRKFKPSSQFFKDLKKHGISAPLLEVLQCLLENKPIPEKYKDHKLQGDMKDYRECHIYPDVLLLYQIDKNNSNIIKLIALDNHSNLFD